MENTKLGTYEVFKDFFGEKYVDLQSSDGEGDFILVYWPKVTVTNEFNRSIDISDLYAKIRVTEDGKIPWESTGFYLNRASYDTVQFLANYMHSHVNYIPKPDFTQFQIPCLGRGPIRDTIVTLKTDGDPLNWMLFCQELSMYVQVESVHGIPYHKLENVLSRSVESTHVGYSFDTNYRLQSRFDTIVDTRLKVVNGYKTFIKWYLENGNLKFVYKEGKFNVGMRYYDFLLDISNAFIKWLNMHLVKPRSGGIPYWIFSEGFLCKVIIVDNRFYSEDSSTPQRHNFTAYVGKKVCTFKGEDITVSIRGSEERPRANAMVMSQEFAMCMLYYILNILNSKYNGNTKGKDTANTEKVSFCI